jgi:GGDEF domain-containing protein
VLPDSDRTVAAVVADRLRRKLEGLSSTFDSTNLSCKVSTGTASIEKSGNSQAVDILVASADAALHSAKHRHNGHSESMSGDTRGGSHGSQESGSQGPARQDGVSADDALVGNPLVIASRLEHLRACIRDE